MRFICILVAMAVSFSGATVSAGNPFGSPSFPTDVYELYVDPLTEAFPGQDDLLIPLSVSLTEPAVGINVTMIYDPSLISPILIAPNFFYQSFQVDLSEQGRLTINLLTDLPPPPEVPPIEGDTVFAWLLCEVSIEDPGYDVMTFLDFYEDPYTPYPDNSILLENGGWVTPPALALLSGDILVFSPLYGDININGFPYEIGDAVTFMNYFMGLTEFNARQYANSDCNRDGIQASIADLVFLLCVINGDSVLVEPPPDFPETDNIADAGDIRNLSSKKVDRVSRCDVFVNGNDLLGGAYFVIEYDSYDIEPLAVMLDSSASPMELSCAASEGKLVVALYNWNPSVSNFSGGRLFSIVYDDLRDSGGSGISVTRADFSDNAGTIADFDYSLECFKSVVTLPQNSAVLSVSGYPNPFNGSVSISYSLPADGDYHLSVYDILGRQVRILADGFLRAGENTVIWDGADDYAREVASGIYFARMRGGDSEASVKLFLLK